MSHSTWGYVYLQVCHPPEELVCVVHQGLKVTVNICNTNKLTQSLTVASAQKFKKHILDDREFCDVCQGPHLGNSALLLL